MLDNRSVDVPTDCPSHAGVVVRRLMTENPIMMNTSGSDGLLIRLGGHPRTQLLKLLTDAGIGLNAHAETMFAHPTFDNPAERTLRVVVRSVEQLGLDNGGVQPEVFAAARNQGLGLCPLVTGPYLRLALMDQADAPDSVLSAGRAPTGAIHVASEPVSEDVEYPKGFYLRVVDGQRWLRGFCCDDTYVLGPKQQLAFVVPQT